MIDAASISHPSLWTDSPEGYFLMFIAMFIGGPAVTSASAFAAAFGVFNVWFVFLASIISNLIPDAVWYAAGFWGREQLIERLVKKYGRYVGIKHKRVMQIEHLYETHVGKTLVFVKLVPFLAIPGLIAAGMAKVPIKKYTWWSIIVTVPTSLFFLIVGYYFGAVYERILHYTEYGGLLAFAVALLVFVIWYFYRKFTRKLAKKIEQ